MAIGSATPHNKSSISHNKQLSYCNGACLPARWLRSNWRNNLFSVNMFLRPIVYTFINRKPVPNLACRHTFLITRVYHVTLTYNIWGPCVCLQWFRNSGLYSPPWAIPVVASPLQDSSYLRLFAPWTEDRPLNSSVVRDVTFRCGIVAHCQRCHT